MPDHPTSRRTWAVLLPAMLLPFAASLFYFVLFSESHVAKVIYGATKLFTVVWPLIAVRLIFRTRLPPLDIRRPTHRRAVPIGVLLGVVTIALMFALMRTPLGAMVERSAPDIRAKAEELGFLKCFWPFALFLSLVHSFIEEYYWRWFVFGRLRTVVRKTLAHLLAGAAFSLHHIVVATQFFPFAYGVLLGAVVGVGGIVWSLMYDRQQTLVGAWICHLLTDLGIMTIGHRLLFGSYI